MRGFWRKDNLEGRLRESRPEAPNDLVQDIARRVEGSTASSRKPTPLRRLSLAGIAAVAMVTMFAAFGGAGFAASGVSGAAASTADALSTLVKADKQQANSASKPNRGGRGKPPDCEVVDPSSDDVSAARGQYCPQRVTICHVKKLRRGGFREITLTLPARPAAKHLRRHRLDYLGPCTGKFPPPDNGNSNDDDGDDGND
jgi:hypothetical protein